MKKTNHLKFMYLGLTLALTASAWLTIAYGDAPWDQTLKGAIERLSGSSFDWNPLLDERIPRLIVLLCTGASLAVSGAVMQALFQNPLASPSVLGISCGASLMVVLTFAFGIHIAHPYAIPFSAFFGSLATLLCIYFLSRRSSGVQVTTLLLTGIAISTLLLAIQGAITYALRDHWQLIQTLTEWEAGSTADRTWQHVHMCLPLTLTGLLGCLKYTRELDVLALGEEEAKNLGVEVSKVRFRLFLSVAILTGGAIAAVGIIAFFGLVLPHVIRRFSGPENKYLIPLCILGGAASLCSMDILLRIFSIHAFSIGNVSAVFGGVFFLLLLSSNQKKERYAET